MQIWSYHEEKKKKRKRKIASPFLDTLCPAGIPRKNLRLGDPKQYRLNIVIPKEGSRVSLKFTNKQTNKQTNNQNVTILSARARWAYINMQTKNQAWSEGKTKNNKQKIYNKIATCVAFKLLCSRQASVKLLSLFRIFLRWFATRKNK